MIRKTREKNSNYCILQDLKRMLVPTTGYEPYPDLTHAN